MVLATVVIVAALVGDSLIDLAVEAKVDALLAKSTLEEKIGQLNHLREL